MTKIDPRARKVVGSPSAVAGPGAIPTGIALGGGSVWVAIYRPRTLAVVELGPDSGDRRNEFLVDRSLAEERHFVPSNPVLLAFGGGSLWALEVGTGEVWRIDPDTGRKKRLTEGEDAWSIAYGHGFVWLGGRTRVTRLDPDTGKRRSQPLALAPSEDKALAIDHEKVWLASSGDPFLFGIEPRTMGYTKFDVPPGPGALAVTRRDVWVASSADRSVTRIDPDIGRVARIPLGNTPAGIASSSGLLWTTPARRSRFRS